MKKEISFSKIERLAKTGGIQGWTAMFALLAIMCLDQFVLEIPFENVVFPILVAFFSAPKLFPLSAKRFFVRLRLKNRLAQKNMSKCGRSLSTIKQSVREIQKKGGQETKYQ